MLIKLLVVGKLKEPALRQLCDRFTDRLQHYTAVEILEIKEEKLDENQPREIHLAREAKHFSKIMRSDAAIALDVNGKAFSSEELAVFLQQQLNQSRKELQFLIGGPLGIDKDILANCWQKWSLSRLTITHEMARYVFLEQLYRAFSILRGESYHK